MYFILLALVGFGAALMPPPASAQEQGALCKEILALPVNPDILSAKQLLLLATAHDLGECVPRDLPRAFKFYRLHVSAHGINLAALRLGYFYHEGLGVQADQTEAQYWFRSYAKAHPTDTRDYWKESWEILFPGEAPPTLFLNELDKSNSELNAPPEIMMRNFFDLKSGNGIHPSAKDAEPWLTRALALNYPPAHYERARLALNDEQNLGLYVSHLSIAAELNDPTAQAEYGQLFLTGKGVKKWPYSAFVWLLRAQKNGQDVNALIHEAEKLLDPVNRKLAIEKAEDFDFTRQR